MITLSWPWKNFETLEQEIEFFKLAVKFKGVDTPDDIDEFRNKLPKELQDAFDTHLKRWCWIPHWYDNEPFDDKFLLEQLKKFEGTDVEGRYNELYNKTEDIKKESQELLESIDPSDELREKIKNLRKFTYFRTQLDLHTSRSVYHARPLYYEIAKRIGLTFYQLKFLTPKELISFLTAEKPKEEALNLFEERKDLAFEMFDGLDQSVSVGEKAQEWVKEIKQGLDLGVEIEEEIDTKELKGMGASIGTAEGPARVITSVEEIKTVQEGEVLVVPSTSIDFVVAMKKAVAIVTEVGGLTSHAAIVSRELGIPCIVNTKIATKVLKTGMKLRVVGDKGIVEIL